jgi:hypothetical protein
VVIGPYLMWFWRPQVGPIARSSASCLAAQLSRKLGVDEVVDDSEVGEMEGQ